MTENIFMPNGAPAWAAAEEKTAKKSRTRRTKQQVADLVRQINSLLESGMRPNQVCVKLDLDRRYFQQLCVRELVDIPDDVGPDTRKRTWDHPMAGEWHALYAAGVSFRQMAKGYSVTHQRIHQIVTSYAEALECGVRIVEEPMTRDQAEAVRRQYITDISKIALNHAGKCDEDLLRKTLSVIDSYMERYGKPDDQPVNEDDIDFSSALLAYLNAFAEFAPAYES